MARQTQLACARSAGPALLTALLLLAGGCGGDDPPPNAPLAPPPGAGVPYAPAPGAPGAPMPGPTPGYPASPAPAPPGVAVPGPPPAAPGAIATDPITQRNLPYLRQRAQEILAELVLALPPAKQQRVFGIPLVVDDTPGEVNAFAACSSSGKSAMAITDGLLEIQAVLALGQAHDELFGTRSVDAYVQTLATGLRPGHPVPPPPPQLFPYATDGRVVARQHQIFEEQVAFVLGHELGHHHLGHLPCTAVGDALGAGELGRLLSNQVPLFNQPNEIAADLAGTYNVLDAGRARAGRGGAYWTEAGGLLTMRFFAGLGAISPADLLTAFERSHPPPQLRTPIIGQAANTWRSTGGAPLPLPGFGF